MMPCSSLSMYALDFDTAIHPFDSERVSRESLTVG